MTETYNQSRKKYRNEDIDLIKGFFEIHTIAKYNLPLNCVSMLNVFLEGHGLGKHNAKHESGYGPSDLLDSMHMCQIENDKANLNDNFYSTAIDENTTRNKSVTAAMIRYFIFLYFFCYSATAIVVCYTFFFIFFFVYFCLFLFIFVYFCLFFFCSLSGLVVFGRDWWCDKNFMHCSKKQSNTTKLVQSNADIKK